MNLDEKIEVDERRILSTGSLYDSNMIFDMFMNKIEQEAENLQYDQWYGIDTYDGNVLLQADENRFISLLYGLVLKRKAGIEDYRSVFRALHLEHMYRIDVIDGILNSEEARTKPSITITGLEEERKRVEHKRRLKAIPVIGRVVTWLRCWLRLPEELNYLEAQIGQINLQLYSYDTVKKNVQNINRDLDHVKQNVRNLNVNFWRNEKEFLNLQKEVNQMERLNK